MPAPPPNSPNSENDGASADLKEHEVPCRLVNSHTPMDPSEPPRANSLLSGENANEKMATLAPFLLGFRWRVNPGMAAKRGFPVPTSPKARPCRRHRRTQGSYRWGKRQGHCLHWFRRPGGVTLSPRPWSRGGFVWSYNSKQPAPADLGARNRSLAVVEASRIRQFLNRLRLTHVPRIKHATQPRRHSLSVRCQGHFVAMPLRLAMTLKAEAFAARVRVPAHGKRVILAGSEQRLAIG